MGEMSAGLSWGLLVLRLGAALVFLAHGWPKMIGQNITRAVEGFARNGIPFPHASVRLAGIVQTVGGLMLLLGLGTRYASAALALTMLVAVAKVKWKQGFVNAADFPFILMLAMVTMVLAGAGPISVDSLLR